MSEIPPALYRPRDLYLFVSSRFISVLAIQVQSVAIGWQIYDIARTPWSLGLVGLCQFVPMFLCTLPAGELTDRFNQRRVYSLAALLQAGCSALFLLFTLFTPARPGALLCRAGAVRRGARLCRAVRPVAAAVPGAAGTAAAIDLAQLLLLSRPP